MDISEKQRCDEDLILNYVSSARIRTCYLPRDWTLNLSHEIQEPHPDADGSKSAGIPYDYRCIRYRSWVRAALEELYTAMDAYNKEYKGYRNRNKYFNKAAKLAFKAYRRLSFQDLTNPLVANSKRMRVLADLYDVEFLLRERCGFENIFPTPTGRPMPQ